MIRKFTAVILAAFMLPVLWSSQNVCRGQTPLEDAGSLRRPSALIVDSLPVVIAPEATAAKHRPAWNATEYAHYPNGKENFFRYHTVQVAIPMIVAGGLLMFRDKDFANLRNGYMTGWRYYYDDYVQYAPAAIMLGLKAFGLEGRSSWGRLMTSAAFSVTATVVMVNGLKLLGLRRRPDGSAHNSFPSGHTATAFATATMLHKEYGTTVSPWFSVGGYTIATAVGISRILNNKHWLSDVMAGAGFGILATELGYYITDNIFREKGIKKPTYEGLPATNGGKPSFIGYMGGPSFGRSGKGGSAYIGVSSGVLGAWFISDRIGVGGELYASTNKNLSTAGAGEVVSLARTVSANAGLYLSWPLGRRWLAGAKLLGGVSCPQSAKAYGVVTAGGHMTFIVSSHFGVKIFAQVRNFKRYEDLSGSRGAHETTFPVTVGLSFNAMLW